MKFNKFKLSKSLEDGLEMMGFQNATPIPVSYTHLRAHETS